MKTCGLILMMWMISPAAAEAPVEFLYESGTVESVTEKEFVLEPQESGDRAPRERFIIAPEVIVAYLELDRLVEPGDQLEVEYLIIGGRKVVTSLHVLRPWSEPEPARERRPLIPEEPAF